MKEDRRLERKPASVHGRFLGEYFSMWSNTSPDGGLVIVGQEDEGEFSGCATLSNDRLNALEKSYRIYCPDARVESKRIPVIDASGHENFVVAFRVQYREDSVVFNTSNDAYIRIADEKHKLTPDEVRELQIDKGQLDLEREPVDLAYPTDFRIDLIKVFADGVRTTRNLSKPHTDIELLEHRRLGRITPDDFAPNVACALLFSKDPNTPFPGCSIRFLRYDGETEETGVRYNVIKDIWLEGCIPELIVEIAYTLESQLRTYSKLGEDGKFYTAPNTRGKRGMRQS